MTVPAYRARPARGFARVARVVLLAGFAVAGGAGAAFLLLVVVGVAGVELDPVTWGSGAPDDMFRGAVGPGAIAIGASLGVGAIAQGAYRLLYVRQLAREARAEPNENAAWQDLRILKTDAPFTGVWIYGVYFFAFDALAVVIFTFALGERPDDPLGHHMVLAAGALGFLMAGLMLLVGTVWTRSWAEAAAQVRSVWGHGGPSVTAPEPGDDVGRTVAPLRRFVRRIGGAAGVAGAIGAGAFMIAVYLRKPCRRCETRHYDALGEAAIDVLMTVALPFSGFALVVLVLSLLTLWLASVTEWSAVSRLARDGGAEPDRNTLTRLLSGWWPGSTAGVTLLAIGWGAAPVITGAALAAPGILPDALVPVLLAVGLLGALVVWWSIGAAARSHNRLREAWSLPDLVPSRPARKRRRTR